MHWPVLLNSVNVACAWWRCGQADAMHIGERGCNPCYFGSLRASENVLATQRPWLLHSSSKCLPFSLMEPAPCGLRTLLQAVWSEPTRVLESPIRAKPSPNGISLRVLLSASQNSSLVSGAATTTGGYAEIAVIMWPRGHQPFSNWGLLLGIDSCEGLPVWYTHFWNKNLLNLSWNMVIKLKIFINVKTLIMYMLLSEQARGRPMWSVRATWCPRTPCWWPLMRSVQTHMYDVLHALPWGEEK